MEFMTDGTAVAGEGPGGATPVEAAAAPVTEGGSVPDLSTWCDSAREVWESDLRFRALWVEARAADPPPAAERAKEEEKGDTRTEGTKARGKNNGKAAKPVAVYHTGPCTEEERRLLSLVSFMPCTRAHTHAYTTHTHTHTHEHTPRWCPQVRPRLEGPVAKHSRFMTEWDW